jgi:hypothetical protein
MKKILIQSDCAARGEFLKAGQVFELTPEVADELMRIGRAVEAPAEEAKPKAVRRPKADAVATITE